MRSRIMKHALAYLTLALAIAFAVSPAVTDPFTGFRADQLPVPQIEPPVQPAGYAFAIWGVIYLWLIASAGFGAWKRADAEDWHRARPGLAASLAIGVPWLAIANASAIWATITIFLMAAGAIVALLRSPDRDLWLFRAPVGLYAGWLTAASFVSLATTAAGYGIAFGQTGWAWAGIAGAAAVAATVLRQPGAGPVYGIAVIWALAGIVAANGAAALSVSLLAGAGIAVTAVLAIRAAALREAAA